GPAYLRLGAGKATPEGTRRSGDFKIIKTSEHAEVTIFALGPIANNVLEAIQKTNVPINLLTVVSFPFTLNEEVIQIIQRAPRILIAEEHVSIGGLGQQLSLQLLERDLKIERFQSIRAKGYPNGLYGSQRYHQQLSGLDADHLARQIKLLAAQHAQTCSCPSGFNCCSITRSGVPPAVRFLCREYCHMG